EVAGPEPTRPRAREDVPMPTIEEVLSKGQEILVQVSKEPIGSKGARITSHISLPGRYVVYMPTTDHIGVSRRIEDEKERQRLRDIVATGRPKGAGGFIVRTACEGLSKREIVADMRFLSRLWSSIVKKSEATSAPALLHADLDIVLRAVRDLFTSDVRQVVLDRPDDHQRVIDFVDSVLQPKLKSRVEIYEGVEPIFDHFGIENQVNRALERRVWLKSGGYLVFDQTEALTTIDVNTGRFVGKKTHEETVLKTNLEAARVAIDQLRLRNIGGIIIIDFIDMEKAANRKKVSEALAEAVKRDKARTNILRISELGLVQMTRKRTRDNLRQLITTPCPTCNGDGRLKSVGTLAAEALRIIRRHVAATPGAERVTATVSPEVATALHGPLHGGVDELEEKLDVRIAIRADAKLPRDRCDVQVSAATKKASGSNELPVLPAAAGPAANDP
ncbi:MAG: Rne/Rng family ribonuclease, partial [Thermodesulfobacteriota bacterium]